MIKHERKTAHNNSYPNLTPAIAQTVKLPGPMKAAVITIAGPEVNELLFFYF